MRGRVRSISLDLLPLRLPRSSALEGAPLSVADSLAIQPARERISHPWIKSRKMFFFISTPLSVFPFHIRLYIAYLQLFDALRKIMEEYSYNGVIEEDYMTTVVILLWKQERKS